METNEYLKASDALQAARRMSIDSDKIITVRRGIKRVPGVFFDHCVAPGNLVIDECTESEYRLLIVMIAFKKGEVYA